MRRVTIILASILVFQIANGSTKTNIEDNSIEIIFTMDELQTQTINTPMGKFTNILTSSEFDFEHRSGAPKLPEVYYLIGVPVEGEYSISYKVEWGQKQKVLYPVVPVDSFYWDKSNLIAKPMIPEPIYYESEAFFEEPVVAIEDDGFIRSQKIARIIVKPIKYNYQQGILEIADKVSINVKLSGFGELIPEGAFEDVLRTVLVNYEQAKNFRYMLIDEDIPENPFDAADSWIRIPLKGGGIYAITKNWFEEMGIEPNTVNPKKIRLYATKFGNFSPNIAEQFEIIDEVPLLYFGNDDSVFDECDTLIFYNVGPEGWILSGSKAIWLEGTFSDSLSIWIALDGAFPESPKRLHPTANTSFDTTIKWGRMLVHYGENKLYDFWLGNGWYNQLIRGEISFILNDLRIVSGSEIPAYLSPAPTTYDIRCNGQSVSSLILRKLRSGLNNITLIYNYSKDTYFKFLGIDYPINLVASSNFLHFYTDSILPGKIKYEIFGFTNPIIFDVTNIWQVRMFEATEIGDGEHYFVDSLVRREYVVFERNFTQPIPMGIIERDFPLWNPESFNADYLLLSPKELNPESLAKFWENRGLSTRIIWLEDIYHDFGYGRFDPVAIRNFLQYAYNKSSIPKPQYAVFVGDGHLDYRYRMTDEPNLFPPAMFASHGTDAFYATINADSNVIELMSSRLPVKNQEQLDIVIDKMTNYIDNPDFGDWKIRAIIAADDEYRDDNATDHLGYTRNANEIITRYLPSCVMVDPIYLIDFPRTSALRKPTARDALLQDVSKGAIYVDWIGHGNYHLWAHERLLNFPMDLPGWDNGEKLPLVSMFSCDNHQFYFTDNLECIGEDLLRKPSGGAVATIGATSGSTISGNQVINKSLVDLLFYNHSISIGAALVATRRNRYHDSQYILFGDPAMKFGFPHLKITMSLDPDTLYAAQWITVSGDVETSINGKVQILLFGPRYNKFYESPVISDAVYYIQEGDILFSGLASVHDGYFELPIFVPKNLQDSISGYRILAYAYSEEEKIDAVGLLDSIPVELSGSPVIDDTTGPEIFISFELSSFVDGGKVCSPDGSLPVTIQVSDPHGIDFGSRPGHGLIVQLDNEDNIIDISSELQYSIDDPTFARATYSFENVEYGGHTICAQVWDNLNNVTQKCVELWLDPCEVEIYDVIPYPNPFKDVVDITFALAGEGISAYVVVTIYTVDGKQIRQLTKSTTNPFDWITWDGKTEYGDDVGKGIYMYVLKAEITSKTGKRWEKIYRGKIIRN